MNETLKKLKEYVAVIHGTLTKEEFTIAFKTVVTAIAQLQAKVLADNKGNRESLQALFDELKAKSKKDFDTYKQEGLKLLAKKIIEFKQATNDRLDAIELDLESFSDDRELDKNMLREELFALIPTIEQIENDLPKLGTQIRDALELLQGDERLDISAIKGWEKLRDDIAAAQKSGKPVTFVGGARGIYVYIGGVKKGIMNTMNFAPGTGMSIAYSKINGLDTLTFNATGGGTGGITVETPAGNVDGNNTQFTPTSQPQWVVSDGTTYYEGAGYTWDGTHINMVIPPSSFIRDII